LNRIEDTYPVNVSENSYKIIEHFLIYYLKNGHRGNLHPFQLHYDVLLKNNVWMLKKLKCSINVIIL